MKNKFFNEVSPKRTSTNKIQEMSIDIKTIFDSFMEPTKDFNNVKCLKLINNYIKKHDRLLYSIISNYIFSLKSEDTGVFITNLDSLTEFVLSHESLNGSEEPLGKEKLREYRKIKKTVLKLWDHAHLALYQFENLKQSDDEFKRKFINNIEPVKNDVTKELNDFTKTMNSQLISLIGIFTAMSFLVFGSINSLDDIFKNARNIPILQAIIIGSIWGICITNLVFVFMFFVSKMTKLNIKSSTDNNATLVKKYPLIFWSNLILLTILGLSSWLYYIDTQNIGGWFINIGKNNSPKVCITGFGLILAMFIICSLILIQPFKKKKNAKNKENNSSKMPEEQVSKVMSKSIEEAT